MFYSGAERPIWGLILLAMPGAYSAYLRLMFINIIYLLSPSTIMKGEQSNTHAARCHCYINARPIMIRFTVIIVNNIDKSIDIFSLKRQ